MTLAFLNIGTPEIIVLLLFIGLIFWAIGNYGRDTVLGFWGSILVALFTTPLVAFLIIFVLRNRNRR